MLTRRRFGIGVAAAALGLRAVVSIASAEEQVVIFAAASLKNALDEISRRWESETGGRVAVSYAGSSALARQIEQGAPADLFISADLDWMAYLSEQGLIEKASEVALLGNSLVLIAPAGSSVEATIAPGFDLAGLLGKGRLAIASVDAVPAGRYGKAALETLGVWASVQDRLAQAENVRAALALVSTGEAPLGVVYRTDAAADPDVRIVDEFPSGTHPPIVYPAALVAGSGNPDAEALFDYLQSGSAKAIFEKHGFSLLTLPASN